MAEGRRPVVLLDVDGVLADFCETILLEANFKVQCQAVKDGVGPTAPHVVRFDDITDWRIESFFPTLTPEEVFAPCSRQGFVRWINPLPGAKEAVAELQSFCDVVALTSPWHTSPFWQFERTEWLGKHFNIAPRDVIHASRKAMVAGDILVDDRSSHVREWQTAHKRGCGLLWDAPYNREDGDGLDRVASWADVVAVARHVSERTSR